MKKRVILIGIGLLIQIIQLVKTNAKTLAKNNLLNIVRSLTSLTPTELIKNFDKL